MRLAILLLILASAATSTMARCDHDNDCSPYECCREYLPLIRNICVDKGEEVGDICGGQFKCNCRNNLTCVDYIPSVWNKFRIGTGKCQVAKEQQAPPPFDP